MSGWTGASSYGWWNAANWGSGVPTAEQHIFTTIGDIAAPRQPTIYVGESFTAGNLWLGTNYASVLSLAGTLQIMRETKVFAGSRIDMLHTAAVLKPWNLANYGTVTNYGLIDANAVGNQPNATIVLTATATLTTVNGLTNRGFLSSDGTIEGGIRHYGGVARLSGLVDELLMNVPDNLAPAAKLQIGPAGDGSPLTNIGWLTVSEWFFASEGTHLYFDMGPNNADQLVFENQRFYGGSGVQNATLHLVAGTVDDSGAVHKFAKGEMRGLMVSQNGPIETKGFLTEVTGQRSDFAYYVAVLKSQPHVLWFKALNSGETGGAAIMDMSAATAAAVVNYVPQVNSASVKGGLFYGPTLGKSFAVKATTHFIGTKYADTMTVDTYFPKIKAVTYYGRAGDDELSGGRAADALYGESGKDTLDGKAGIDRMAGGLHDDIYVIDVSADRVIELAGQGKDLVQSTASTFTLPSNVEFLALMGKGNIRGTGNSLANVMAGNDGANILDGKAGNDVIVGAAGADILIGDAGRDILSGGLHNDIFRYLKTSHSAGNLADVITDFDQAGNDRIDLSALIGPTLQYIHNAKFTKAGQVRINDVSGADIVVEVNTSGTSGAELSIWLTKTALGSMSAADFIL